MSLRACNLTEYATLMSPSSVVTCTTLKFACVEHISVNLQHPSELGKCVITRSLHELSWKRIFLCA